VKIRRHFTYANVTATLALLLALGGGAAYAVDKISSRDVVNGSIRSVDLKNHKAVRGIDVKRNSLTGREIKEGTLRGPGAVGLSGDETVDCVPTSFTAFTPCARTSLRLETRSRVLLVATGNQESVGGPGQASCRMSVDGVRESLAVLPGEAGSSNTSGTATNGFARTLVSRVLNPGIHQFALTCQRFSGAVRTDSPTIAVVAVGAG
jgi:hypothetical protein